MADHLFKNTHKKTPDKKVSSPAVLLRSAKDKAAPRAPINRGKAPKAPSPEEILRAKKQSMAKKERR